MHIIREMSLGDNSMSYYSYSTPPPPNLSLIIHCIICRTFSKWNYHWSLVAKGDFSKLNSAADEEKNKPKIKFKIVPPPPKAKPEPPPPPPPKKTTPPKPMMAKRKVEVDVFRLHWRESWMSLKPPKYLYLKAKELKARIQGFTTIEIQNIRIYKPTDDSEAAWVCPAETWSDSWKQVPRLIQTEGTKTRTTCKWFQYYSVPNLQLKRGII